MTQIKVLFICKRRNNFYGPSFGLINSCRFIANALEHNEISCKVVVVTDNNDIDREVSQYRPSHVFIEALWVVPEKFEELIPLHPNIQWYARIHSKVPFLANEGMAVQWLRGYHELTNIYSQFHIAANSVEPIEAFAAACGMEMEYFPNIYYPDDQVNSTNDHHNHDHDHDGGHVPFQRYIDVGCFGAIRPMKNHLNQALSAIAFGNEVRKKVRFHINSDRCETGGDPVLKNLVYAFKDVPHKLILHPWVNHDEFIKLVKSMELGMQVSLSETFNIVAADFAWHNIPIVGSDEVFWLDRRYKADPNCVESMIDKLRFAYKASEQDIQEVNRENLIKYNKKATKVWLDAL